MKLKITLFAVIVCMLTVAFGVIFLHSDESDATADPSTGLRSGDVYYTVSGTTATVIGYASTTNWSTFDSIPDTINYNGTVYTVTSISAGAFENSGIRTLTNLPSGLVSIDSNAFHGCGNLTSIVLPNGLTTIGASAFSGCTHLTLTSLPSTVTSIGGSAFQNCTALALTSLPNGLTAIDNYAFNRCTSLALTSLPDGVTSIGVGAFSNCTNLALTSLSAGLTIIDPSAFYNCTSLALTSLPNGVVTIGSSAFYNCTSLALTSLPNGLTEINVGTFESCTNLALTSLPENLVRIYNTAFNGCTNLALTSLPDGVTSIGANAFNGCTNLALTSLPNGLTSIGQSAFSDCTSLALTSLPSGLTSISSQTFSGCTNLALTELPAGLTFIGSGAFVRCTGLTYIILPQGLSTIDSSAFVACTNLATVYNASSLAISAGSTANGNVAQYANAVYECHLVTIQSNEYGTVTKPMIYAVDGTTLTVVGDTISSSVPYQTSTAVPNNVIYAFQSWSSIPASITSDITVTATFIDSTVEYTVSFQSNNPLFGTVSLASVTVRVGSAVSVNENSVIINGNTCTATPTASNMQYTYSFVGWANAPQTVTQDVTITAVFSQVVNEYVVTFTVTEGYGHWSVGSITAPYGTIIQSAESSVSVGDEVSNFYLTDSTENREYVLNNIIFPAYPLTTLQSDMTVFANVSAYNMTDAFNIIQPQYPDMVIEKEDGAVWTLIMVIPIMLIVALIIYAVKFGRRDDGYNDF